MHFGGLSSFELIWLLVTFSIFPASLLRGATHIPCHFRFDTPSTVRKGGRSGQLDPPNRTAVVELAFQFDERGSIAIKDPYLHVRWLLARQMRQQSSDPSDFHSHSIMHCFQFNRAMDEWFPAFW